LLRITRDANGNPIEPHNLPFIPVGDSDELGLGDELFIFGYPGIGGSTITFTTGTVGGFETVEINNQAERLYIKTEADVAHGNSGGTAVNVRGELVGVPTRLEPDRAGGVTWSVLSVLMPINLVQIVRQQGQGAPPVQEGGGQSVPPTEDPDPYEPNDSLEQATGPCRLANSFKHFCRGIKISTCSISLPALLSR
jgi:S1-C subfamily serine protease